MRFLSELCEKIGQMWWFSVGRILPEDLEAGGLVEVVFCNKLNCITTVAMRVQCECNARKWFEIQMQKSSAKMDTHF